MNLKELDSEIRFLREENLKELEEHGLRDGRLSPENFECKDRRKKYLGNCKRIQDLANKRWKNTPGRAKLYKWMDDNDVPYHQAQWGRKKGGNR